MDLERLQAILEETASELHGSDGAWEFTLAGVQMACLTDTRFDRMRVIAPILEVEQMSDEQSAAVMEANFHTALDARYATSDGVLYAAFIHPLSPLSESELVSALSQVASLVQTYGTAYSGGTVFFAPH